MIRVTKVYLNNRWHSPALLKINHDKKTHLKSIWFVVTVNILSICAIFTRTCQPCEKCIAIRMYVYIAHENAEFTCTESKTHHIAIHSEQYSIWMQVNGVALCAAQHSKYVQSTHTHCLAFTIVQRHRPQNWNQLGIYFYIGCLYSCQHHTWKAAPSTSLILPLLLLGAFVFRGGKKAFTLPYHRAYRNCYQISRILMRIDNKIKRYWNKFRNGNIYIDVIK